MRLRKNVAPTLRIDYRAFLDKIWEAMPADEYVAMIASPQVLGPPLLVTQHFIGSSRWEKVSDTEANGYHQLLVPHQKYKDDSKTEVALKGNVHGYNKHWYKKIDGVWKFAGLAPVIRWGEDDFDKFFESGREEFGEKEQAVGAKADGSYVPAATGVGLPVRVTKSIMKSSKGQIVTARSVLWRLVLGLFGV